MYLISPEGVKKVMYQILLFFKVTPGGGIHRFFNRNQPEKRCDITGAGRGGDGSPGNVFYDPVTNRSGTGRNCPDIHPDTHFARQLGPVA